jgi:hypothetical protein
MSRRYRTHPRPLAKAPPLRSRGTVLVDYRILRNFVRIYQTLGETA